MDSASASASTSTFIACSEASTSYTSDYDIFINHRGPDVKNTFASYLYRRLISTGLRVFLDKPELVEGQPITHQIEAAIKSAAIQIAIFSPTYAQSKWCLDELILMILSRATILPVFYKVKPSELRWMGRDNKGAYAEALRSHEEKQRYDSQTIQSWREALSTVSQISGFELDAFNGDEGLLLEAVVQRVLRTRNRTPSIYVAKYPTGLKEKLQELESTVLLQQNAKVVGIVGPGGVGKTTLAKEFFNRKRSHYNRSCFLPNIRENADKGSLIFLQRKLLHDLTQLDLQTEYYCLDEGIEKLRKHLVSVSALIILDDVDRACQLEAFLPIKDILSSDSLILVTSRDKHVLLCSEVLESSIYKLKGLNRLYSQKLFCCYAFHQQNPLPEFAHLVDDFLVACDGLPLSLKVLGALVCGETDQSYWQEILNGLHNTLPAEIQQRLKISYDSLSINHQEIFLDIACFFIGANKDTVIRICSLVGLRDLENKCLLEVDSENKVKMHDQIRDLGRNIAQEGSRPLRLWHHPTNNVDDLIEQSSRVITHVRGIATVSPQKLRADIDMRMISAEMPWYKRWIEVVFGIFLRHLYNNFRFCGILNLEFVATEDIYLERILSMARSPHLKWLRWYTCQYTALPSWIPMKDLRVLEVAGKKLKILWQQEFQAPLQLRELNISGPLSSLPKSIGQLNGLEKIVISHALLETLPDEFCELRSLLYLELKYCSKMKSLPDSLGKLAGLQYIDLEGASLLQSLPNSFGNLSRLRYLSLRDCSIFTISNVTLGNIRSLQYLDLSYCSNVKELPPQVAHQRSLEKLCLYKTKIKGLRSEMRNLCQLKTMKLGGNGLVEMLPRLLGCLKSLKELYLFDCPELKCLPDSFGLLTQLAELDIKNCPELKCLPDSFGLLTQLTKLRIEKCGIEFLPQDLLKMNNLEIFEVEGPLRGLPFKRVEGERKTPLMLNKLDSSNDKCMLGLKELYLFQTNISELCFPQGVCPNLEYLYLHSCKELRQIEGLGGLAKLRHLYIDRCPEVEEIHVSECHEIPEMSGVKHLMSLEYLWVSGAGKLRSIQGLGQLIKLQRLNVHYCHEIQELPGMEHLMCLKWFYVRDCPKLQWGGEVVEQLRQRLKEGFVYI